MVRNIFNQKSSLKKFMQNFSSIYEYLMKFGEQKYSSHINLKGTLMYVDKYFQMNSPITYYCQKLISNEIKENIALVEKIFIKNSRLPT